MKKHFQLISLFQSWLGRYKYWLTSIAFLVHMMFFDQYRIPVAISIYSNVALLEQEKLDYQKLIVKVREDKRDIENNYEKFAREKYYMSRSDEDVFVIDNQELKKKL
jgi:cell division protein DivIC